MYNIRELQKKAEVILKKSKYIIFHNMLFPQLGVSEAYYYESCMKDIEFMESINNLMARNRNKNTTKKMKELDAQTDTGAIVTMIKLNNAEARRALNTVRQENVEVPFEDEAIKEATENRLDELEDG